MTKLCVCGLGLMGAEIAGRLHDAGHEVTVWNRTPEKAVNLMRRGLIRSSSPAEAAAGAAGAITMLADPTALDEVVTGPSGLAEALEPGSTLIEMSTVGPGAIRRLAGRLPPGVDLIDAPVLGSVAQVRDRALKIFVGGDTEAFERWQPLLTELGTPRHLGPLGSGAAMKLVTNLVLGALMTTLGEALTLADGLELRQADVLDVLQESPIGATTRGKRERIESGRYPPNFRLALARKDLDLIAGAAAERGIPLKVSLAARTWFEDAEEAGLGELDYSAVIPHLRGRKLE
ncbi:MAG: NAD(P)-dependent oxidoreductase [Actinomycetota bacterium]